MSTIHDHPDEDHYEWKSNTIGADKVIIHPSEKDYKEGTFFIGILPFKSGSNNFGLKVRLVEAKSVHHLKNGVA